MKIIYIFAQTHKVTGYMVTEKNTRFLERSLLRLFSTIKPHAIEINKKNAQFVIEEIGKKQAEIFSKLQLGTLIPN